MENHVVVLNPGSIEVADQYSNVDMPIFGWYRKMPILGGGNDSKPKERSTLVIEVDFSRSLANSIQVG